MTPKELKDRTKRFALNVIFLVRELPPTIDGRRLGGQLFDAGTSVAANYRAACRARSRAEFIAKLGIVLEESDESINDRDICGVVEHSEGKPITKSPQSPNKSAI